ncbi:hypothetical protein KP509_20G012800 [Ceratopteris richardii]|uniref:Uncharacterized protein n=1 Tax=Ceratopteris richardii TaxID=49495 RepID=A0A8T2SF88_CERRI|nr:hypothetical protein KP509_20G012800 [Ceratopteris richardii]
MLQILEPIRTGVDVLFFFLPGALTAPKEYLPLLKEVQEKCSLRLWITILDPVSIPWVSTAMIEASFDGVLKRVQQLGFPVGAFPAQGVVMGGHSWGAWESRSVALKRAEAFIQMGSCFHSNPDNLMQYPKPVLTLNGSLDAQLTNAATVKHAGEIFAVKDELGEFFVYGIKPVIMIQGMNHAQFSHGIPNKERGDFDSEISIEQARDIASLYISSFITLHMCGQDEKMVSSALAVLKAAVIQTQQIYQVFWEAMADPGKDVKTVQLHIAALPTLTEKNIGVVGHDYKDNFIYSKPSIDMQAERVTINTYVSVLGKYNLMSNIWVKCKSREAISAAFDDGGETEEPLSVGKSLNERTFAQALALVPESVRQKFEQRGKKLRFLDDKLFTQSAQDWIDSDLMVKPTEDGTEFVDIQSTVLISPFKGMPARFAGMHYLKLLTTARALNWIYEDAFR